MGVTGVLGVPGVRPDRGKPNMRLDLGVLGVRVPRGVPGVSPDTLVLDSPLSIVAEMLRGVPGVRTGIELEPLRLNAAGRDTAAPA